MFRIFLILLFCLFVHIECLVTPQVVVIDADTGAVLLDKNGHKKVFCASCTKIGTALYTLSKAPPMSLLLQVSSNALIMAKKEAKIARARFAKPYALEVDGVGQGLVSGDTAALQHFLHSMLIGSCNDSANVIAENIGGSIPKFMLQLNQYLKSIGCKNTHFMNPHGLHHPDHQTTASDLALMAQHLLTYPIGQSITRTRSIKLPFKRASNARNTNKLLHPGKYFYPHAEGMKTGYTQNAKYCLVAVANNGSRRLIAVLLNAPTNRARYTDAIALFEKFFNEIPQKQTLFKKDQFCHKLTIDRTHCLVGIKKDIHTMRYSSDRSKIKSKPHFNNLTLPIRKNQVVGHLEVFIGKQKLTSLPLVALEDVSSPFPRWIAIVIVFLLGIGAIRIRKYVRRS